MTKKIAIIGSAPSSLVLAPFDDPSWEIWGCSGGAARTCRRVTKWFELHHFGPGDPRQYALTPDYVDFLKALTVPVYMIKHYEEIPTSVPYPKDAMIATFGPYFWTSSVSWMLAMAIMEKPEEIGLWGIDMAAREEYHYQRPGCHHFITIALKNGIKVTVPPQSDLLKPPPMYGMCEPSSMTVKLLARQTEIRNRIAQKQAEHDATYRELMFLRGAEDDLDYSITIWADQDPKSIAGH